MNSFRHPLLAMVSAIIFILVGMVVLVGTQRQYFIKFPDERRSVDSLANGLRASDEVGQLQGWCMDVMARYRANNLKTAGKAAYLLPNALKVDNSEVSNLIAKKWGRGVEIVVIISSNNVPEAVGFCGYRTGILIGPQSYVLAFSQSYIVRVQAGVYVYRILR